MLILGAAAVIVFVAALWWGPGLLERRIADTLRDAGLAPVSLRVASVGPTGTALRDIRLGDDQRLSIDTLHVSYTPGRLRAYHVDDITITGARLRATLANNRLDLGSLLHASFTTGGDGDTPLPFTSIHLQASTLILETPDQTYHIDLRGTINHAEPDTLDVDLTLGWRDRQLNIVGPIQLTPKGVDTTGLTLALNETDLTAPGTNLTLAGVAMKLTLEGHVESNTAHLRLKPASPTIQAVQFNGQQYGVTPGELLGELTLNWGGDAGLTASGHLALHDAKLTHEASKLTIPQISIALPLEIGPADNPPGTFSTGPITLGDQTYAPVAGTLHREGADVKLTGAWPLLDEVPVSWTAGYVAGQFTAEATTGQFDIVDPHALSKRYPMLSGVELSGTFELTASMSPQHDHEPRVTVKLANADLQSRKYDLTLSKINGSITLDRLSPIRSPLGQSLTIDKLQTGKLELHDGRVRFAIVSGRRVFIERLALTLGQSGRLTAHAFEYDLDEPRINTQLYVERLNLGDWLSVLTNETIRATGQLHGRIPVTIRPRAQWKISLGEGFLYAGPEQGTMQLPDAQRAGQLLDQADPRFRKDPELAAVRGKIVEALTDFEYSMFRFNLIKEGDDMMLRIETRGQGRTGENPQQIGSLVINVHNFDELVNQALVTQTRLQIDQALEQFFKSP